MITQSENILPSGRRGALALDTSMNRQKVSNDRVADFAT